ncbi:MAG TPA: protein translocase subunit SecF [Myxococcaceae bacterium]|nr:protein translocase subunit SecF [Myxococcaceae bacterium]
MRLLKHTPNIDFIGKRKPALFISSLLNLVVLVGIGLGGLNFGVDFAGGTVVELKFKQPIDAQKVRERAERGGLAHVQVQQIGPADENSYLLKLGGVTQLTQESAVKAETAIRGLGPVRSYASDLENGLVNFRSEGKLDPAAVKAAVESSGTGVNEVRSLGEAQGGGFDYQVVASGMADAVNAAMMKDRAEADFWQQRVDYVGPQVGKQLRNQGVMALLYAMLAILVYVAFRFDFKFGPGALLAMLHDVIMTCGYFLVTQREFNLTSIAVLLTVTGYSINDTIVVYDRIRETMHRLKGKSLPEIINVAVNETLARTILTSGVTALSLVGLLIFGVGEIFDFAAAMLVGIVVGTYSSVYIASPLIIWMDERSAAKAKTQAMNPRVA